MSCLWSVNSLGRVFTLSTSSEQWEEVPYHGTDIKRVAANEFFTWAISSDHQIYLFVPARDVPIRFKVITYENERWNPVHGFSSKLLPTDRPHWSSADGLVALPLDSFTLPSPNWQWEGEWYIEDNLEGQPLEPEGWTYALDFPATYGQNKSWNSLVRRRKWVRYRRYAALNRWAQIASIHEDPVQEPFIDVSVGGQDIPGGDSDKFVVWAVTILGRVIFRYGITTCSPEGTGWVPVDTPNGCEVFQISSGPTGLVWAVSWAGHALARVGVTRENGMGTGWLIVEPPKDEKLVQVSVGTNVVWAVTQNKTVWFRKGVKGVNAGTSDSAATGTGWIEMVGNLLTVSVGLNDQVWALDPDGMKVYIRTGVTPSELSGRTWKAIEVPVKMLHRVPSLSSLGSRSSTSTQRDAVASSEDLSSKSSGQSSRKINQNEPVYSPTLRGSRKYDASSRTGSATELHSAAVANSENADEAHDIANTEGDSGIERRSICSIDGGTYVADFSSTAWDLSVDGIGEVINVLNDEFSWMWISASGCFVEQAALPLWFSEGRSRGLTGPGEAWYDDLLHKFKARESREITKFSSLPKAVEKSTWVKTGGCEWYRKCQWVKCLLELEQQGIERGVERGFMTCHHKSDKLSLNLNEITCVARHLDRSKSVLTVYTEKRTLCGKAHKFSFTSDEDLEDWWGTLSNSCLHVNNVPFKPGNLSLWSTTTSGDVYVHNVSSATELESPAKMFWYVLGGGHLRIVETNSSGVVWALGYNCTAWVYTGGYGGGPYKGISGSNVSVCPMSDTRCFYIYENQRWNPLTGFSAKGLPTDRYMWSDQTGRYECTKENTHLPSSHWQWISDWCIDYKTPGGVDNLGWQYATDFPRSYHSYKSFTDYVRRRRWVRKCRLLTSGPWKQLGTTQLLDISFQVDCSEDGSISAWAVAANGDVLRRIGVTKDCPEGETWVHVPTEKPFRSISVGADGALWGVAKDGSAQMRHGISSTEPNGLFWCHVEPPRVGCHLRQISAGRQVVVALDENNRLWSRQEIVEIFKEGTHWKLVSENVRQVSVGPSDEIWAVMESFETPAGILSGVVCQRIGMNEESVYGTEWKQGIGGSWNHICIRGCSLENAS